MTPPFVTARYGTILYWLIHAPLETELYIVPTFFCSMIAGIPILRPSGCSYFWNRIRSSQNTMHLEAKWNVVFAALYYWRSVGSWNVIFKYIWTNSNCLIPHDIHSHFMSTYLQSILIRYNAPTCVLTNTLAAPDRVWYNSPNPQLIFLFVVYYGK